MTGLADAQKNIIRERAESLNVPHNFGRTPRDPIKNLKNFVVEEWFSFADVTGPMLFWGVHAVSRQGLKNAVTDNQARKLNGNYNYICMRCFIIYICIYMISYAYYN